MTLFRNKYRIESSRLTGYDYSSAGWYFVTICTGNRIKYFGDIVVVETSKLDVSTTHSDVSAAPIARMHLSEIGQIADYYWNEIPNHFSNVNLDVYQIMPNHIHGIIQLLPFVETPKLGVSTNPRPTIGIIINQFKRICTITTKNANLKFKWQPRFHDHIIRDNGDLELIRTYIKNNPRNWNEDKFNI